MGKRIFFVLLTTLSARLCQAQSCSDIFPPQRIPSLSQMALPPSPTRFFSVHNSQVENILTTYGVTSQGVSEVTKLIYQAQGLDIPVDASGFVAAANVGKHHGGYGNYVWHRDFARVYQGLAALPEVLQMVYGKSKDDPAVIHAQAQKRAAALAMVRLLGDSQWREAAIANIDNVVLHSDPNFGFKLVIWVRRLLEPFQQNRALTADEKELESRWAHKQNDALATFAESVMDAVKNNDLALKDFPIEAQQNFVLLASYFIRLEYWRMWDSGAWEEGIGPRTSSIALVANFLKRFQSEEFAVLLKSENLESIANSLPDYTAHVFRSSLSTDSINNAILQGQQVVQQRLSARPIEIDFDKEGEKIISRYEDTALLHLLWSSANLFTMAEKIKLIDDLKVLEGPSGYARYKYDWFLYGSAQAAKHINELGLTENLAIPNGQGGLNVASPEEVASLIEKYDAQEYNKDLTEITALGGADLEAQWTLPDAYLTQFYADLYTQTSNVEFLEKAKTHYARLAGLISGAQDLSSEAKNLPALRLPEAYLPVVILRDGKWETVYMTSPNSPLNWATAEFILATQKILKALSHSSTGSQ